MEEVNFITLMGAKVATGALMILVVQIEQTS